MASQVPAALRPPLSPPVAQPRRGDGRTSSGGTRARRFARPGSKLPCKLFPHGHPMIHDETTAETRRGEAIRDDLLSVERLEERAAELARDPVDPTARPDEALLARTRDNGRTLVRAYRMLAAVVEEERATTPAAEWLVDNFHVVDEALSEVRNDLPPGFYRKLPVLAAGPRRGMARVFALAWAFVAHTDSRFEPSTLQRFLLAFQRVEPLRMSELWAVPIALRMTLLENLRRLAQQIVDDLAARIQADRLADALLGTSVRAADPEALAGRDADRLPPAFAVELTLRLRGQDPR